MKYFKKDGGLTLSNLPEKLSKMKTEKGLIVFGNLGIVFDLEQF